MANNDVLDEILDIARDTANALTKVPDGEQAVVPSGNTALVEVLPAEIVPVREQDAKLETDFEFARDKMRDLIKKGQEAVDSAIMLAQSGDSPRAYEVVGGMITAIIQANKELISIHKTRKDTQQTERTSSPSEGGGSVTIDKAVFVGRASDLLREIRALTQPKVDDNAPES
jgi:hypothetical protein